MIKKYKKLFLNIVTACLLTACAATPDAGPDYYLLSSAELDSKALDLKPFKLALGPVEVPAHLDREGIATHDGQHRVIYSDNHRWAEALNDNLIKTLHANLAQLLPRQQLIDYPYRQTNRPKYQLSITIEKFGYLSDDSVVLKARSVLLDARGRQIDTDIIDLKRAQDEKDYAVIVAIMSELLGEMSIQLANRISEKL